MRKYLIGIIRIIASSLIAFIVLTIFCYFYYNIPVHSEAIDGATDYKWKPNTFYSRGTEGFAFGKVNNDGYNNNFNYYDNMKIDVLVMGSSQMEAYNVQQNESTSAQLNNMLHNDTVYNIGISSHNFLNVANNLQNAVEKYNPTKFVVIETSSIKFSEENIKKVLNGNYEEIPSKSEGVIGILQRIPLIRLAYKQLSEFANNSTTNDKKDDNAKNNESNDNISILLDELLSKMNDYVSVSGSKLIIFYHPSTVINNDGTLKLSTDVTELETFKELCLKNNVYFLDMSERFLKEYNENHILPYGFINSSVGSGHLNKNGHKMIAEELYKIMKEVE